jgi:hypothetical protein
MQTLPRIQRKSTPGMKLPEFLELHRQDLRHVIEGSPSHEHCDDCEGDGIEEPPDEQE